MVLFSKHKVTFYNTLEESYGIINIKLIGPMHEEKILGNTKKTPLASFSLLKVGIPLMKINIYQRFKYH